MPVDDAMSVPKKLLIEGLDRLGKDLLVRGVLNKYGYYQVLHFSKPQALDVYTAQEPSTALQRYQEESFRTLFQLLLAPEAKVICNRAHLGECVYAPLYRGYSGDYVFEIERTFRADTLTAARLLLLTEDFEAGHHFVDDGLGLGDASKRRDEQARFLAAFERSTIADKRTICVTDRKTGAFRPPQAILDEALE
jgi:hypothetical protein